MSWTSLADIKSKVRRRWEDGSLLRALAAGEPFPVIDLPLRGPKPAEIGDDLGAVQAWVADLTVGASTRGQLRSSSSTSWSAAASSDGTGCPAG